MFVTKIRAKNLDVLGRIIIAFFTTLALVLISWNVRKKLLHDEKNPYPSPYETSDTELNRQSSLAASLKKFHNSSSINSTVNVTDSTVVSPPGLSYERRRRYRLRKRASGHLNTSDASSSWNSDLKLAESLADFFSGKSVLELGGYSKKFTDIIKKKARKVASCVGTPSSPSNNESTVKHIDLTAYQRFEVHDWVLSLEFGSQLDKEFELIFIDNIHRHNKEGVVLSWSMKGDQKLKVSNAHSNRYIKKLMQSLGYSNDLKAEAHLRSVARLKCFKSSLMVFRRLTDPPVR